MEDSPPYDANTNEVSAAATKVVAVTTDPNLLPSQRRKAGVGASSTWQALKELAPEVADVMGRLGDDAVLARRQRAVTYDSHPGFKQWLLANFALNIPTSVIRSDLAAIVADQEADGLVLRWPTYTKRQLDTAKYDLADEWAPIEHRLTTNIENVGVLSKNRRLLALAQLAERVMDLAFTERNSKTDALYLIPEVRAILHQIAEEKGELGESGESTVDVLGQIALELAKSIKVQGSGIQTAGQVSTFDYEAVKEQVNEDAVAAVWREVEKE